MQPNSHPRLTYANVVATLALFIALGGASALAAVQPGKNTVGSRQLKASAVTTGKIANGAVTAAKLAEHSLTATQIDLAQLGTVPTPPLLNSQMKPSSSAATLPSAPRAWRRARLGATLHQIEPLQ